MKSHCCLSAACCAVVLLSIVLPAWSQAIPRPEHPRPDLERAEWLNLNGAWEFGETDESEDARFLSEAPYPDKILVPFARESKLSGLERTGFVKNVWYRRSFSVPAGWKSKRLRLHIGASDYRTRVWVNGRLLGEHSGGSAPFAFDLTHAAKRDGRNVVVVHAFDDTRSGLQPLGKQCTELNSVGCSYTRTTGIWQTVWLEGVGSSYIKRLRVEPDRLTGRVTITPDIDGPGQPLVLKAAVIDGGKVVAEASGPAFWRSSSITLTVASPKPWGPGSPALYQLRLQLLRNGKLVDELKSYFGFRDIAIDGAAILLNGKPVFQRLILDQGYYPSGVWTAPTDAELRRDIERSMACGYNGARLHQKVFEPRFLYWADKLGYMVWGEYPNWGLDYSRCQINTSVIDEWLNIVKRDGNHPSIVGWCPFNETPTTAGPLQNSIVAATRAADPSRPIIDTSGYIHSLTEPDVMDAHDYEQDPARLRARYASLGKPSMNLPSRYGLTLGASGLPFMVSEFGGIGWNTSGGWGYGNNPASLEEFYSRYKGLVDALLDNPAMFGFCYTQLTDVEQEKNGLYTYERKPKFDLKRIKEITSKVAAIEKARQPTAEARQLDWVTLVGAAVDGEAARQWKYTFEMPSGAWVRGDFDDSGWKSGLGAFGLKGGSESTIRTLWNTPDIWLRQQFSYDGESYDEAQLVIHYDNATRVFVNGQPVWSGDGWNNKYDAFAVTDAIRKALRKGTNTIAVHCHQDAGGQMVDLALLLGK